MYLRRHQTVQLASSKMKLLRLPALVLLATSMPLTAALNCCRLSTAYGFCQTSADSPTLSVEGCEKAFDYACTKLVGAKDHKAYEFQFVVERLNYEAICRDTPTSQLKGGRHQMRSDEPVPGMNINWVCGVC